MSNRNCIQLNRVEMDSSPEKKVPKPNRCNARLEDFIQVKNVDDGAE